jgi:hypothetical protein
MKPNKDYYDLYIEGNNGADYVHIDIVKSDRIRLDVGYNCVHVLDKVIPNELLPIMINEIMNGCNGNIIDFIDKLDIYDEYKEYLKSKIV